MYKRQADDTAVSIREYFPAGFAERNPDKTVAIVGGGEYIFNEGLMEFMDINRKISSSELPALIPVFSVFEENGTVYAVSQSFAAITMAEFLQRNGGTLKWEQARPLFLPLIDTLKGMNDIGVIHGGISCDTVLVGRDGKLRISGYSVKRLRAADGGLKAELFPGFAAVEQYNSEKLQTGAYTDVYGLCAVLFNVLIGTVPPEAPERLKNDSMTIPAKFAEELPLSLIHIGEPQKKSAAPEKRASSAQRPQKKGSTAKYVILSAACTAAVFIGIVAILVFTVFKNDIFGNKNASDQSGSVSTAAPSVDSIGTIDSGAAESAVLFSVPSLTGKYYAELADNEDYEKFTFVIKGKEFNDKYAKGQICAQSLAEGTQVARDTKIEVTISLGPKEVKIANVVGLEEINAKLELLKQGFLYDNIEVLEKYDENKKPGAVLEQEPKYGTQISPDSAVTIYVNSYKGDDSSDSLGTDFN